jgi:hypothetical protein
VAFAGSYELFRRQLKEAWVRLTWEELFDNGLEEQLAQRKQLMPVWFGKGCIRYFASGWPLEDEDELKMLFDKHQPDQWATLTQHNEMLAGQAFCYFLSQRYRRDAVKQVFFQLRQGKSLSRSVRLITKRRLDTLTAQCLDYYRQRFGATAIVTDTLTAGIRALHPGSRLLKRYDSPDGKHIAYCIQKANRRSVYVTDEKALLQGRKAGPVTHYLLPPWLEGFDTDHYPLLQWSEKGRELYLTLPEKGILQVRKYTPGSHAADSRKLYGVDGVNTFLEWRPNQWLLAAYRKGKSDIVMYDASRLKYSALTDDLADNTDLALSGIDGNAHIAYRSGYPADSVYHKDTLAKPYGIYTKAISGQWKPGEKETKLVTDSAYIRWQDPQWLEGGDIAITQGQYGTLLKDTFSAAGTPRHITQMAISPWLRDYLRNKKVEDSIAALEKKLKEEDVSVLGNILVPANAGAMAMQQKDSIRKALAYTGRKVKSYILQLYSAYFSASINNDYFINRYQPYQNYLGAFKFPETGAMAQGGFSDLFDNHHFNIGYRMPAGTEGSDFFVRYANTARKLDWHVLYFRKVESLKPEAGRDWKDAAGNPYPSMAKVKTHYYELGFHYPLHYDWSLDVTLAARKDRTVFLATDRYSLNYEALQQWWSLNTLSLTVNKLKNNSIPMLKKGWEAKVLLDGMASTGKQSTVLYGVHLKAGYHQPLFRGITLVTQVQAGYSGGQSRILYNFGGMDNNIVPRTDTSKHFTQDAPYAFQTLITPFRGYEQNSIYGSSFALVNMDLYIPLFHSLIPLRTSFSALNNLQLGFFADMAATGQPKSSMPVVSSPLYAYGFSARTMLAGYPIRFDMAWPGNLSGKPVWYLSLTLR